MKTTILIPKNVWKSKTFLITLFVMLLVVVFAILKMNGILVPDWILVLVSGLGSVFIGSEKIKDAKEASFKILTEVKAKDILDLKKPIVNSKPAEYLTYIGIVLNILVGALSKQPGVKINPSLLVALNTIIATFVGFDKYKEARIKVAATIVKKKAKK